MRSLLAELQDLIYPGCCALCQRYAGPAQTLCSRCLKRCRFIDVACLRCGGPIKLTDDAEPHEVRKCIHCSRGKWPADRIACLATYEAAVRQAVIRMKQPGSEALLRYFADRLVEWSTDRLPWSEIDFVMPVPQHWSKRLWVRHNASEVLAQLVADRRRKPLLGRHLIRLRKTGKQGLLLRPDRAKNVEGAYAVRPGRRLDGKHILVVDDIVTTGATAAAITLPLKAAGAAGVYFLAVARGVNSAAKAAGKPQQHAGGDRELTDGVQVSAVEVEPVEVEPVEVEPVEVVSVRVDPVEAESVQVTGSKPRRGGIR